MRIVFDQAEQDALRADARELVADDPQIAYVLERLAGEGIDMERVVPWEDLRENLGQPPLDDNSSIPNVA
ncbi:MULTISPECIES: hypothetical protein [unclassified Streptomyces]|uniref:hypothetical protein n=1 Tax=unclassified Streptomyces TaxID=2593676 RepID=UPI00225A1C43|nr:MULTISPECIES: hypothetical protein [unclassified Streptomyces]MCX4631985.1 hypothetical protein [Streptomyces sp. NBC_01443]WSW47812.1 hypothetical protein OG296_34560 [Streptomyces sp. NBC_01001]